jgi:hypothetical protein
MLQTKKWREVGRSELVTGKHFSLDRSEAGSLFGLSPLTAWLLIKQMLDWQVIGIDSKVCLERRVL